MSLSKKDLTRLGFGGVLGANQVASFIDDNKISHKKMRDTKIDIINKGTLRKQKPVLVIQENINTQKTWKTDMITDLFDKENKNFYSEYTTEQIPFGQISFFNCDKFYYNYANNDFFVPFKNSSVKNIRFGADSNLSYVKLSYPQQQNISSIIGKTKTKNGLENIIYNGQNISFSGRRSLSVNRQFKVWTSSNTSGINNNNYSLINDKCYYSKNK